MENHTIKFFVYFYHPNNGSYDGISNISAPDILTKINAWIYENK
jgi:hypothetical protein